MNDFDFLMFGGAEVERFAEEDFNERWNRLVEIHNNLLNDFASPVLASGELTSAESAKLEQCLGKMNSWHAAINGDVENATQDHLARYASAIGKAAVQAIRLCGRYGIYDDITSVEYVSKREMVVLNGADLWFLG